MSKAETLSVSQIEQFPNSLKKASLVAWVSSISILIITLLLSWLKVSWSPESIALRYNVILGVTEVGSKNELFKLPILGAALAVINFVLARIQKFDRSFILFLAGLISFSVNVILLLAVIFLFKVR